MKQWVEENISEFLYVKSDLSESFALLLYSTYIPLIPDFWYNLAF